jgi:uncharacterized membrane protein
MSAQASRPPRLDIVDALRGAIMIVMALDHVRDFIHRAAATSSPTDLATTTPILFLTRWITHFCAPVFMFTAGIGIFYAARRRSGRELTVFLLTRGLWLALLEATVMRFAFNFNWSAAYPVFLIILWALGLGMIVMAILVRVPPRILAALSVLTIALHNLLDPIRARQFGDYAWIWNLLHQPGAVVISDVVFILGYPILPWTALMALGFCFGPVMSMEPEARRRRLASIGVAAIAAFVVIRAVNVYGDPAPWATQGNAVMTMLSFLNLTKQPPSLLFALMTLGPALVVLAFIDRAPRRLMEVLVTYGRVPLFYYVAHFFLAHLVALALAWSRYGDRVWAFAFQPFPAVGGPPELFPADFGFGLATVYAVWLFVVVVLYPACRWFARVKATRTDWWLSYL